MNKLIIVGAGGFGREVLQWALQSNENNVQWKIAGFLDDDIKKLDGFRCEYSILGTIIDWEPKKDEQFVVAIGAPATKKKIVELLTKKEAVFENVIHQSVVLASTIKLGRGIILCPNVVISDNAVIQDHVIINNNSCIGHDARVGEYTTINSLCDVTGEVLIGDCVFMSSSSCIIPQCKIGEKAYICAGSVVMNNVSVGQRVLGVPAKKFEIKV